MRAFLRVSILVVALLAFAVQAGAQGGYDIRWQAVPGGGGISRGGPYALAGSILPHAGALAGKSLVLHSGFWSWDIRTGRVIPRLWLPMLIRGQTR